MNFRTCKFISSSNTERNDPDCLRDGFSFSIGIHSIPNTYSKN